MLTGTVAALEQVLTAMEKVSNPLLQKSRGVIPVAAHRNSVYTARK